MGGGGPAPPSFSQSEGGVGGRASRPQIDAIAASAPHESAITVAYEKRVVWVMPTSDVMRSAKTVDGRQRRVARSGGVWSSRRRRAKVGMLAQPAQPRAQNVLCFMMNERKSRQSHCGTTSVSSSYGAVCATSARTDDAVSDAAAPRAHVKRRERPRSAPAPARKTAAHAPTETSESSVSGSAWVRWASSAPSAPSGEIGTQGSRMRTAHAAPSATTNHAPTTAP